MFQKFRHLSPPKKLPRKSFHASNVFGRCLSSDDQGVHAVDGDDGDEGHADDTAHQPGIADGHRHRQHPDPNVPLQQVDHSLRIGDRIWPGVLRVSH